jgi:2-C-methyl-D-erythritol 4-phosphate cytidylyltransferase
MRYGAAIAAVPESDTVKFTDNYGFVQKTLPRSRVFRAQTPQVFKYAVIKRAYLKNKRLNVTDDASLVETIIGVRIVEGSYKNMKITTREDFRMAEALL